MIFDELINIVSSSKKPYVCIDSRLVKKGDIFVAIKGSISNGHDFIGQAIANGAKYIVCQKGSTQHTELRTQNEFILVDDTAQAAAVLAQASRGNPSKKLTNLAVTGTNGKTTVAFLVHHCISQAGRKCGLIGTVLYDICSDTPCEAPLTTPDCLTIAAAQQQMVQNGAKYMVIEASSHALSQNRLAQNDFAAAAFTNLSGDHLDYHKTKEDYSAAKTRLFVNLPEDAFAVLNKESPEAESIARQTQAKILWYATEGEADLTAHIESMDVTGAVFTFGYCGQSVIVKSCLPGRFNISNCLAAAGLCLAAGLDLLTIADGLYSFQMVPGRLEKVNWGGNFTVIIDYAHTDDALKNVLQTLKPLCKGKLRVVFGCGGDRDKTKRPRMAKVAEELADIIYVTSDNPRTEDPQQIIDDIVAGFERNTIIIETDRKKAIEMALEQAGHDDIVLIAGKGHEDYQIIGKSKIHFSDKEIAQQYLKT